MLREAIVQYASNCDGCDDAQVRRADVAYALMQKLDAAHVAAVGV